MFGDKDKFMIGSPEFWIGAFVASFIISATLTIAVIRGMKAEIKAREDKNAEDEK